ncbi:MAG: sugar ABC transporter permease [Chloroflexi bacterium]|nr:sugar ABC transporter permease [Chloroflexota bacterium]
MSSFLHTASLKRQRQIAIAWRMAVAFLAIAFALLPVIYIFSASINPASSIASRAIIPPGANFGHYRDILTNPEGDAPFLLWMRNSLFVSIVTSVLVVTLTSFAAYAFSRFRFRGRQTLLKTILLAQVFPNILAIVALFLILRQLGQYYPIVGIDSLGGLILIYLGGAMGFNTWLMKGFFDSIPRDLDESAQMDGASSLQTFFYIILPLVRPILVVIFILTFIGTYGDYLLARVMLKSTEHYTLAVGLSLFVSGRFSQNWGPFAAGALMAAIPTLILFYLVQDQLQSGLTVGAVKG